MWVLLGDGRADARRRSLCASRFRGSTGRFGVPRLPLAQRRFVAGERFLVVIVDAGHAAAAAAHLWRRPLGRLRARVIRLHTSVSRWCRIATTRTSFEARSYMYWARYPVRPRKMTNSRRFTPTGRPISGWSFKTCTALRISEKVSIAAGASDSRRNSTTRSRSSTASEGHLTVAKGAQDFFAT